MKTTLNQIKSFKPCTDGWKKLLRSLGKTKADDEPLSIITVLDSNGLDDALWCLKSVVGHKKEKRLYAVWCARKVQHLMTDPRSTAALDVAERFANSEATEDEIAAARDAAWAAAGDAAWAAAGAAAKAASEAAAGAAAGSEEWTAARAAAGAEAAARAAAWAAAGSAAGAAEWASAKAAALATAAQESQLRRICAEIEILETSKI